MSAAGLLLRPPLLSARWSAAFLLSELKGRLVEGRRPLFAVPDFTAPIEFGNAALSMGEPAPIAALNSRQVPRSPSMTLVE